MSNSKQSKKTEKPKPVIDESNDSSCSHTEQNEVGNSGVDTSAVDQSYFSITLHILKFGDVRCFNIREFYYFIVDSLTGSLSDTAFKCNDT